MTLAALKRLLTPGTRVHITNHYIPGDSRVAEVLENRTTEFSLTHPRAGDGGSWIRWPKASQVVENDDGTVTILGGGTAQGPEEPFLTLAWVADGDLGIEAA